MKVDQLDMTANSLLICGIWTKLEMTQRRQKKASSFHNISKI